MQRPRRTVFGSVNAVCCGLQRLIVYAEITAIRTEAANLHFHQAREFSSEVIDVHASSTIDIRWKLIR